MERKKQSTRIKFVALDRVYRSPVLNNATWATKFQNVKTKRKKGEREACKNNDDDDDVATESWLSKNPSELCRSIILPRQG